MADKVRLFDYFPEGHKTKFVKLDIPATTIIFSDEGKQLGRKGTFQINTDRQESIAGQEVKVSSKLDIKDSLIVISNDLTETPYYVGPKGKFRASSPLVGSTTHLPVDWERVYTLKHGKATHVGYFHSKFRTIQTTFPTEEAAPVAAVAAVAAVATNASPLPSGWVSVINDKGRTYYYSKNTSESTWNRPTEPSKSVKLATDASSLPSGWEKVIEANGTVYYWEAHTGKTQWDAPEHTEKTQWDAPVKGGRRLNRKSKSKSKSKSKHKSKSTRHR
jgi:hypothetical protein